MKITNREGLTWEEWACAAGIPSEFGLAPNIQTLNDWLNGWQLGEDPTEYRTLNHNLKSTN